MFIFIATQAHAIIRFEDAVTPELASSGRALAMGNAFLCKVDDSSAVLYNPAGLGTVRNSHLHFSNFHLELNKGWMDISTNGSASDAVGNFAKAFKLDGLREEMVEQPGKLSHSKFSFMPNFTMRHFSAGYLYSMQTRATLGTQAGAQFEFADRLDHGPYAAINIPFLGGIFKVGATGIFLIRKEIIDERDPNTTLDIQSSEYTKGTAFIMNAGAKLTFPVSMLPTVAIVTHNALDKNFASRSDAGNPTRIERTISTGFSLTPQIGQTTRIHLEVNFKDMAGRYTGVSGQRRTTFGMEFDFFRAMFVRFGYGDGYGSGGLGLRTQRLEFDLTTYAVDSTSSEFRGVEDRRFALTMSSGW